MGRAHKFRDDDHEHEHVTCPSCQRDDIHVIDKHDRRIYELHTPPGVLVPCLRSGYLVQDVKPRRSKQSSK